jgi:anion-transporting  ArsA/GET3 family ATPase
VNILDAPIDDADRGALRDVLEHKRVVVCVGSGGVGKTTTAATLGLVAASLGRRALVITIDPARRLANALGLDALAHAPQRIDAAFAKATGHTLKAPLSAMMLDLKHAWDDMLLRTAPDRETAEKIFDNRFYDALSRDLPGAHEFIATEQLHHLSTGGAFDVIVLDTPPTQNALDFLDAPNRILSVLDNDAFRFFATRRQSLGLGFLDGSLLQGAAGRAQSVLARFAGAEMLEELGDFIVLLRDLYDPLTTRTKELMALLHGQDTRFVLVTSPLPSALREARFFVDELVRRELALGAVIANRVTRYPGPADAFLEGDALEKLLTRCGFVGDDLARLAAVLHEAVRQESFVAQQEHAAVDALAKELLGGARGVPVIQVPRMTEAVHDAARLAAMAPWLVGRPLT